MGIDDQFDVFISHASEDKARFVEPLLVALRERGVRVWYDAEQIGLGADFRRRMDEGLATSRFGVVILSPRFFKYWPEAELSALFTQEATFDVTRILPVRCDLDRATVVSRLPLLSARADVSWEKGVAVVADQIRDAVRSAPVGSRTVRSPVYNLPSRRARKLFGREVDLQQLDALLVPGSSVQMAASIEGLAGVGKTELALHIVDRLTETGRFPGGIFWFDAENPDLTTAWGSVIADGLAVGSGAVEERAAAALRIASSGPPIVIVLDNVESWTSKSEPKPLPSGPHAALLVTTRQKFLGGRSFEHHTLEVLPPDAAREFLTSVASRNLAHSSGTEDLLRYLDGHSLAIELAGAYLREFPSVTPAEYVKKLEEGSPVEEKVQDLVRYEATVRSALDVHWSNLNEVSREALLVAACFAAEDATLALLEACGVDADAQQPLRRFHLITGDGERWRMHRLVREWAQHIAATEDLVQAKHKFVDGCAEYSRQINLQNGFRIYRDDGKHLEQAMREAESILNLNGEYMRRLHDGLGVAMQSMGDLPRAKQLLELALASTLENLGKDHPSVATRRTNLATVLQDLGDLPRARELLELALTSQLNSGEDTSFAAITRSNLAIVFKELGDLPRAKELLELALASDLKNLGEGHPSVAIRRSNLATVLQNLGDLPRAKELLELALASDLKNLGEDHPSVAIRRSNLATVLYDLDDPAAAKGLFELALTSDLKNLGEDHPTVAKRRFNLAALTRDAGDLAQARMLFSQTLSSAERSLGTDHPFTAVTRASLASVLNQLGETETAHREAERALCSVANQPVGSRFRSEVERIATRVLGRT